MGLIAHSNLPPEPMATYEDYLRAINDDLWDMSEADLLLELECVSWIYNHYPAKIIFVDPALYFSVAEWAYERAEKIHGLLVSQIKPTVEPRPQTKPAPASKASKPKGWKIN